jgi:hypothetical protein
MYLGESEGLLLAMGDKRWMGMVEREEWRAKIQC